MGKGLPQVVRVPFRHRVQRPFTGRASRKRSSGAQAPAYTPVREPRSRPTGTPASAATVPPTLPCATSGSEPAGHLPSVRSAGAHPWRGRAMDLPSAVTHMKSLGKAAGDPGFPWAIPGKAARYSGNPEVSRPGARQGGVAARPAPAASTAAGA
ncbi:hypothetical protein GCM10010357_41270 [Streptomyces luteireticuli]|uniref:Uncharacterized protein n=1 Tax=Streptomyces luteireticuli TaxID=173858 RepID=A0ABN0YWH6_9ACTN